VYTANNGSALPGDEVRAKGAPATGEEATDEAYSGVDATLAMYAEVFDRDSFDDKGALVRATVHYEKDYDNAFWNGQQLVFGDGDGKVFGLFTRPIDVLGHEFTHAVTQYTANLTYNGQSGALNESISDVFGSCLKQRVNRQSAAQADWLIGAGIFLPSVQGKALRSMAEPGTAYDDPVLGKDPQVASMKDYVNTTEDNGGVHTNSGIPNRAFNLAATAIGGTPGRGPARSGTPLSPRGSPPTPTSQGSPPQPTRLPSASRPRRPTRCGRRGRPSACSAPPCRRVAGTTRPTRTW
jgi:Zn-dependent metalloprotease